MSKDSISVMSMLRRGVETKLGVQLAGLGSSAFSCCGGWAEMLPFGRKTCGRVTILSERRRNRLESSCGVYCHEDSLVRSC